MPQDDRTNLPAQPATSSEDQRYQQAADIATLLGISPDGLQPRATSLEAVLDDVLAAGRAAGAAWAASGAVVGLRERLYGCLHHLDPYADPPVVVLLEQIDPLVAGGLWRAELIERAGASHVLNPSRPREGTGTASGMQAGERRAEDAVVISPEQIVAARPAAVIVCVPKLDLDQAWQALGCVRSQPWWAQLPAGMRSAALPGDAMHICSPRLLETLEWLTAWLHSLPQLLPAAFAWRE